MWVTFEAAVAPAVKTRRSSSDGEITVPATLRVWCKRRESTEKCMVLRTHILPAFQLSGTAKETELDGGASHLRHDASQYAVLHTEEQTDLPRRKVRHR